MLAALRAVVFSLAIFSAPGLSGAQPVTYLDDTGARFITIEMFEGGRVQIGYRTVGGPGVYGRWSGSGQQVGKGIEFSQKGGDDAAGGPVYVATGQSRLTVKLKPGQAGLPDPGLSGVYQHVSDEKVAQLARKDSDAAEKKLDEAGRMASQKAAAEDKPAIAEWRKAWSGLRDRLIDLSVSPAESAALPGAATKPQPGRTAPAVPVGKQAEYWIRRAELTAGAMYFISAGVPPGLKSGWEGNYEDGFGGFIEIFVVSNGDARFNLTAGRGPEGSGGNIEGRMPVNTLKTAKDGSSTGEFTDTRADLKDGEQQPLLHFRRVGHFVIIESQYAERYSGRGWFDGIYAKRVPPKEE